MSYTIHVTATAERDILRAANYIEFSLKNPTAAEHLLDAATEHFSKVGHKIFHCILREKLLELSI